MAWGLRQSGWGGKGGFIRDAQGESSGGLQGDRGAFQEQSRAENRDLPEMEARTENRKWNRLRGIQGPDSPGKLESGRHSLQGLRKLPHPHLRTMAPEWQVHSAGTFAS